MRISPKREVMVLAAILIVAGGLRLWNLSRAPNGLMPDEASNAYDAWCVLETGADRWSHRFPIFLEAFGRGDYRPALYVYLTVPFIVLLGPEQLDLAVRCPAAFSAILTIAVLYVLVRRVSGPVAAIAAATFLALCPWHLILSRFGHEGTLTPLFAALLVLALEGCHRSMKGQVTGWAPVKYWIALGLVIGLSPYTYASMKLFVPAMLLGMAVLWRSTLMAKLRDRRFIASGFLGIVTCAIIAAPMIWATATRWEQINARAEETSMFHQGQPLGEVIRQCAGNWIEHYGVHWLFSSGSQVVFFNNPGFGQLDWVMLPLILLGLVHLFRMRTCEPFGWVLVLWLLTYPVASALTLDSPHMLRSACGVPAFAWLGGLGVVQVLKLLPAARPARLIAILMVMLGVGINAWWSGRGYFRVYGHNRHMAAMYQADWREALHTIGDRWREFDRVFITDHASADRRWIGDQAYIHVLTFLRIPPHEFQHWQKDITYIPPDAAFHTVRSMGPFTMSMTPEVLAEFFENRKNETGLFLARPGDLTGANVANVIIDSRGERRLEIIEFGSR